MKTPLSFLLVSLASAIALLTIVIGIYQQPPPEYAGEGRPYPQDERVQRALQQSEKLDALLANLRRHRAAEQDIIKDLAARRLTLLTAAARFRDLYRSQSESQWKVFRKVNPGNSDGERFCRLVIRCAECYLRDGDGLDAVVASLERELQDHLKHGTLRLPD
jgi:hypothetical protein